MVLGSPSWPDIQICESEAERRTLTSLTFTTSSRLELQGTESDV